MGACRHQIGGFEHHGVAVGQRRRDLPGGDCDREIPRRDQTDNPNRFPNDFDVDIGANRGDGVTGDAQRFTRKETEDLCCANGFSNPFGERLAFLSSQDLADLVLSR